MEFFSPDYQDVDKFHERFDLPRALPEPQLMTKEVADFRIGFLREELSEYATSWAKNNLVEATDALLDLVYVTYGTVLFMRAGPDAIDRPWPSFMLVSSKVQFGAAPPHLLLHDWFAKYADLIRHQIDAVQHFHNTQNLRGTLHALAAVADSAYGIAAVMKVPWNECWEHVQAANMAKVRAKPDGSDSKRNSAWDVVKPKGWVAPDWKISIELSNRGASIPVDVIEAARRKSEPRV